MKTAVFIFIFITFPAIAMAKTLYVPAQYPTIQDAINASVGNDVVIVSSGKYKENISFMGKAITVKSESGPDVTIIDGGQADTVVEFMNYEGSASILDGFTVTNGLYFGIRCFKSAPKLLRNVVSGNLGQGLHFNRCDGIYIEGNRFQGNIGEGIYCWYTHYARIMDNRVTNNGMFGIYCLSSSNIIISDNVVTGNYDVGIYCRESDSAVISRNRIMHNIGEGICCSSAYFTDIYNNIAAGNARVGIRTSWADFTRIKHNTIADNGYQGISLWNTIYMEITNSILWNNTKGAIKIYSGSLAITYSNIQGGYPGVGNIQADPLFADPANDDYHLTYKSPCRDTGDTSSVTGPYDFEGDPRFFNSTTDIGADEYHTHLYYTGNAAPGGVVNINFIDTPGTAPVFLWLGSGVREYPLFYNAHGFWHLEFPILVSIYLGSIPSPDGVLTFSATIPANSIAPLNLPLQAGIGMKLTNLCVLKIE